MPDTCQDSKQLLAEYLKSLDACYAAHQPYIAAFQADDPTRLQQVAGAMNEAQETASDAKERLERHQCYHGCSRRASRPTLRAEAPGLGSRS